MPKSIRCGEETWATLIRVVEKDDTRFNSAGSVDLNIDKVNGTAEGRYASRTPELVL